jgi:hypothetical protein
MVTNRSQVPLESTARFLGLEVVYPTPKTVGDMRQHIAQPSCGFDTVQLGHTDLHVHVSRALLRFDTAAVDPRTGQTASAPLRPKP